MRHESSTLRRLAALALVLAAAVPLGSCGREMNRLTPPPTGSVSWDNTVRHLLADRSEGTTHIGCTSCHHAGTNLPDWSDYATVADEALVMKAYLQPGGPMRQFLKEGEPEVVIGWIDAGTPEH